MLDLHNDALLKLPKAKLLSYLAQAKKNGVSEIWLSVWTTELKNPLTTIKQKKAIIDQIQGNPRYPLCRLHIEDAWFLDAQNLDAFIALRPHSVGLTWNAANQLAGGAHSHQGITAWGYQVIQRLENAGIQIDTAHLNRKSFWQLAKITTRPLVCTHTALNALHRHPRNLTNRQIKKIIATNGMVGLCLVPEFLTKNTISCSYYHIINHINYFKRHFGLQYLRFGTDFYGTDKLPQNITDYRDLIGLMQAEIIGYSNLRRPIIAYHVGNPTATKRLLITGGMHAREWITAKVVNELHYWVNHVLTVPNDTCLIFVPNCNPDGAILAQKGLTALPLTAKQRRFLQRINHNSPDFSLWKANARAVDLNVNFDIKWGQGRSNITTPAPANYIGPKPHSEPEVRALLRLINRFRPTISLAFHSKGEIIYYSRTADAKTAQKLGEITQYQPILSQGSYGGLTDYLALKSGIPAFTIEVGHDSLTHPITEDYLPEIISIAQKILLYFFNGA